MQSLQSLCTFAMVIGIILTSLGGLGSLYFGRAPGHADPKRDGRESELIAQVARLQKSNDELRRQVELFETMPASTTGTKLAGNTRVAPKPSPAQVKSAPPAASPTEWTGAPDLEQMVAQASATPVRSEVLSERQREEILKVLKKHSGKAISIHSVAGDASGLQFAEALRREFLDAGWRVGNVNQVEYAKPPVGLYVSTRVFPSPEEVVATYQALTAAGLNVSQQLNSKSDGERAVLLVGASIK